ncbi:major facilitator superfamily transporter / nodulin-like [Leishmania donovani]|nr:major facilitator superfamily transporter / nodulin-like [Leishmania donovani]VDZ49479.1 Nodulin-like/Major_Facilitator_Superfamily_putative/Pfam:PF06813/Pfam:PF07690 [Leishmania donovani]
MFDSFKHTFSQTKYVSHREACGLHVIDEVKRFRALVCVLFCSICVSLVFAFDLFSEEFQSRFHLSDGDLSTISTVGVVFCYFVIPYGVLYDHIGPLPLLVIAGMMGFIGCLGLGLVFDGKIKGNTVTISIFYAFMNTCSGLFDAASIVTLVELFPRNRGPVIGLAKVMTGLGSSVISSINRGFFSNNISGFIYLIMVLTVVVALMAMLLIALPPYFVNWWRARNKTEEQIAALTSLKGIYAKKFVPLRRIAYGYVIVACLVIFFAITAPILAYTKVSRGGKAVVGGITVVLCMSFWVMALPIPWLGGVSEPAEQQSSTFDDTEGSKPNVLTSVEPLETSNKPLSTSPVSDDDAARKQSLVGVEAVIEDGPQDPRYGGTIWETLMRPDIWLILIAFVCQGVLGTIVTYNGSTIYVARTGRPRTAELGSLYTALLGVGSAVGRISMGLFEAYVQHQDPKNRKVLVTIALPVAPIIATIAGILILVLPGDALLLPYILVYFEEGVFNGVRALIFPCIFADHHGILYNMSFFTNVIGVIGFNRFLFGLTVDKEREKMGHTVEQGCTSHACVQTPIIVVTCTAAFAVVLATMVHLRYARFVKQCRKALKAAS